MYGTKEKTGSRNTIMNMVLISLTTAVMCITGPLSVPIGPVPISLQTFVLLVAVYVMGTGIASLSCLMYLLMGVIGLPVFTGYQGGIGKLVGPTGGYLVGYIPMMLIAGLFITVSTIGRSIPADEKNEKKPRIRGELISRGIQTAGMVIATVVLYALGTAWFVISTGTQVGAALSLCVIPFIPGDLVKIAVAVAVGPSLRRLLRKDAPV